MSDRLRTAASRVDPLLLVVGAVALVVYVLHGTDGMLSRDLAVYSYAGQRVADGVPPYVGILNRAGPLAHVLPAGGAVIARVLGVDELATMRLLFMAFAVATVCAAYVLGRTLFGSRPAALVTAAAMLSFHGFIEYASNGPREKTPMTLFIVLALLAATRGRWFTAGLFASLATLCLQIAFFVAVTAVGLSALLLATRGRVRAVARVVAGGATPVVAYVLYAAVSGSLQEAVDGFVRINARYTTPDPLMPRLAEEWENLGEAYGLSLWVGIVGLAVLVPLALAAALPRARERFPVLPFLAVLAVAASASLAWNVHEYDAWPDLFPVLPVAAVGLGAVAHLLLRLLPERAGAPLVVAAAVLVASVGVHHSVTSRDDRLTVQRASVAAVLDVLPDATIISVEAPQALVLSGRANPSRHQMFSGGLWQFVDDTWPGGLDGYRRWIVDEQPDVIVFGDPVSDNWWEAVRSDYVYVGSSPDWFWLARRSLDEGTLDRLREAADPGTDGPAPPPAAFGSGSEAASGPATEATP